jgi:phage host-nuclease inhibitor protein Gam
METQAATAAASEQAVRANAENDLGQLRASVSALRTELENERHRGEAATAASVAAMQQERTTLHDQIQTLRDKLETIA